MEEQARKIAKKLEEQTNKIVEAIETLKWKNEALRQKASSSDENEQQIEVVEHSTEGVNNIKVDKKRVHNELHSLASRYGEIAK